MPLKHCFCVDFTQNVTHSGPFCSDFLTALHWYQILVKITFFLFWVLLFNFLSDVQDTLPNWLVCGFPWTADSGVWLWFKGLSWFSHFSAQSVGGCQPTSSNLQRTSRTHAITHWWKKLELPGKQSAGIFLLHWEVFGLRSMLVTWGAGLWFKCRDQGL